LFYIIQQVGSTAEGIWKSSPISFHLDRSQPFTGIDVDAVLQGNTTLLVIQKNDATLSDILGWGTPLGTRQNSPHIMMLISSEMTHSELSALGAELFFNDIFQHMYDAHMCIIYSNTQLYNAAGSGCLVMTTMLKNLLLESVMRESGNEINKLN
jgi:hypothetical protein